MISIALPIHDMDRADFFLMRCLDSIIDQTYEDFEVVITDNSPDDKLEKIIRTYGMKIRYSKNPRRGMAQNTNDAIKRCGGDIIKILYMDDYFAHEDALKEMLEDLNVATQFQFQWLICATDDNRHPSYNDNIHTGYNTLGSPSALMMRNKKPLLFDEEMTWLLDCDYYKRMYELYGGPRISSRRPHVCIGKGDHQITNLLSDDEKQNEHNYMQHKYEKN